MTEAADEANELLNAALDYAGRGWLVIPIHYPDESGGCSCGKSDCPSPAKHPIAALVPHGVKDATCDAMKIREWWRRRPNANVAIATGTVSGIVVIDIDPRHDGDESVDHLRPLPDTVEAHTGGGGRHLIYENPGDERIGNKVGLLPGIDIRADGGYIVAPPSIHASGSPYLWEASSDPTQGVRPAPLPKSVLDLIRGNGRPSSKPGRQESERLFHREGQRNDALFREACALRHRGYATDEILETVNILNRHRCVPPLEDGEVQRLAASASHYEAKQSEGAGGLASALIKCAEPEPDLLAAEIKEDISIVGDRLICAGQLVIFFGPEGGGKSFLLDQLGIALATGRPWLGFTTAGRPVKVGLVSLEMKRRELQERHRSIRALSAFPEAPDLLILAEDTREKPDSLPVLAGLDLMEEGGPDALREFVDRHGIEVLMLDPWEDCFSGVAAPTPEYKRAIRFIRSLTPEGRTVILGSHSRKTAPGSKSDQGLDSLLGPYLGRAADATFRVDPMNKNQMVRISPVKLRGVPHPEPIWCTRGENGVLMRTTPPNDQGAAKAECLNKIREYIRNARKPVSKAEIDALDLRKADRTPVGPSTRLNYLNDLKANGEIHLVGERSTARWCHGPAPAELGLAQMPE